MPIGARRDSLRVSSGKPQTLNSMHATNSAWRKTFIALAVVSIVGPVAKSADITADELRAVKGAEAARVRAIESVYGAVVAIYGNDRQGGGSGVLFDPA